MAQLEVLPHSGPPQRAAHAGDAGGSIGREWEAGQLVMDAAGLVWRCTVAGLPGTWEQVSAPSGASGVSLATVHLSSADLLALSTPDQPDYGTAVTKQLVAAPGAGKVIFPIRMSLRWNPGSTPYTVPSGMWLAATYPVWWAATVEDPGGGFGQVWLEVPCAGLLDSSTAMWRIDTTLSSSIGSLLDPALIANQPLVLQNDRPGSYTDGDGTLEVTIEYAIHPAS